MLGAFDEPGRADRLEVVGVVAQVDVERMPGPVVGVDVSCDVARVPDRDGDVEFVGEILLNPVGVLHCPVRETHEPLWCAAELAEPGDRLAYFGFDVLFDACLVERVCAMAVRIKADVPGVRATVLDAAERAKATPAMTA